MRKLLVLVIKALMTKLIIASCKVNKFRLVKCDSTV